LLADGACHQVANASASDYGEHRRDGHTLGVDAEARDAERSPDDDER
jgi:hypothetical protein